MPLTFATSELVALSLESVFYGTPPLRHRVSRPPSLTTDVVSGMYFALFVGCIKVLYNKRRRRAGGNHRLILVSTTLFTLITWVRSSLCKSALSIHSFPPSQHLVIDIIRLYLAFQGSQTEQGADLYYVRVTSTLSVMKTAVYLGETVVSDLFIVRTSKSFSLDVLVPIRAARPALSVLYRLECEHPHHRTPDPSISRRHW